jgi:ABC-2 type transport system ATP-binding protein
VSAIEVDGVRKRFGDVEALRGVSLKVAPGEIVALLGPNGAGKSTLLRVIATLITPDEGTVRIGDHDAVAEPLAARASFGLMLGEERSLFWRLSGRQNLDFFGALQGLGREEASRRTAVLLDRFGLGDVADRRCGEYSTGMRARLGLARALIAEPPVLLLDEPARSLDPVAAADLRGLLTSLAGDGGTAVLYATHDLHDAAEVAARTIGIGRGEVAFEHAAGVSAGELERSLLGLT